MLIDLKTLDEVVDGKPKVACKSLETVAKVAAKTRVAVIVKSEKTYSGSDTQTVSDYDPEDSTSRQRAYSKPGYGRVADKMFGKPLLAPVREDTAVRFNIGSNISSSASDSYKDSSRSESNESTLEAHQFVQLSEQVIAESVLRTGSKLPPEVRDRFYAELQCSHDGVVKLRLAERISSIKNQDYSIDRFNLN